jgi:hypothetical protein
MQTIQQALRSKIKGRLEDAAGRYMVVADDGYSISEKDVQNMFNDLTTEVIYLIEETVD